MLRGMICTAGDIQGPEAQTAGKAEGPGKTVSPADQQALLQFLRMMRKGKVGHSSGHVSSPLLLLRRVLWLTHMQRRYRLCCGQDKIHVACRHLGRLLLLV